ncbi:MAG: pyridoxamine 5'-phosphate oxidase family protein [Rikenellaceae bacterium]|nr:pyridoxamine 5'-phosphate oxidase family protein [Rikenellaceae bacterium]
MSLCSPEGYGYGIPMHYALFEHSIFFHSAPQGHKLDAIRENNRAGFCVVGRTQLQPDCFSTLYSSVHLFGRIRMIDHPPEKYRALQLLVEKYSPEHRQTAQAYIERSLHRTAVLRLDIEHWSGKIKTK